MGMRTAVCLPVAAVADQRELSGSAGRATIGGLNTASEPQSAAARSPSQSPVIGTSEREPRLGDYFARAVFGYEPVFAAGGAGPRMKASDAYLRIAPLVSMASGAAACQPALRLTTGE
jgi:hypothetical protein